MTDNPLISPRAEIPMSNNQTTNFEQDFRKILDNCNDVARRHKQPPLAPDEVRSLREQCAKAWGIISDGEAESNAEQS